MRFCFYNPQAVLSGMNLFFYLHYKLGKTRVMPTRAAKYSSLQRILTDKRYNSAIIVDGTATSLTCSSRRFPFVSENYYLLRIISFFEIYIWCFLNQINPFDQKIIFRYKQLKKDDVIFFFPHLTDTFLSKKILKRSFLYRFKGLRLAHMSHYFSRTKYIADILRWLKIDTVVSEVDLRRSKYFSKFFEFVKNIYILPFGLRSRYKKITEFEGRTNLALALGTYDYLDLENMGKNNPNYDYKCFFKSNVFHNMRKTLYENRKRMAGVIDCLIAPTVVRVDPNKKQKDYLSYDIVEKYNQYKMFISPEENVGLPSVNVFEGMACGCAYIGIKHQMYADYGMVEGTHYIGYDGSLDDLEKQIKYYQSHLSELKKIADNGYNLVTKKFSEDRVVEGFYEDMVRAAKSGKLISSFVGH